MVPVGDRPAAGARNIGNLLGVFDGKASQVSSTERGPRVPLGGKLVSHVTARCLSHFGLRGCRWFSPGHKRQHWKCVFLVCKLTSQVL